MLSGEAGDFGLEGCEARLRVGLLAVEDRDLSVNLGSTVASGLELEQRRRLGL
jgi:hypothetical protein